MEVGVCGVNSKWEEEGGRGRKISKKEERERKAKQGK